MDHLPFHLIRKGDSMLKYLPDVVTLEYESDKCIGCGMCEIVCPHGVFRVRGKPAELLDRDRCIECGACAGNCPVEAIHVRTGVGCAAGIIFSKFSGSDTVCC